LWITGSEEAAKKIDAYLSSKPDRHFVSEIAVKLGIELKTAMEASGLLLERGTVNSK
jgi:hypothetical protein